MCKKEAHIKKNKKQKILLVGFFEKNNRRGSRYKIIMQQVFEVKKWQMMHIMVEIVESLLFASSRFGPISRQFNHPTQNLRA